ncbi:MAG: hypothetical protein GY861_01575 [bacterium]|nr:hypothetical protein [bacterium]
MEKPDTQIEEIINLLPKNIRKKATTFLYYLFQKVTISSDSRIQYPDGEMGSPILDIVKYFTTSSKIPVKMPFDGIKLSRLIEQWSFPEAAFGNGKHPSSFLQHYPSEKESKHTKPSRWITL